MKRKRITVIALCPDEATEKEIADYVEEALGVWGGQRRPPGAYSDDDPGDPLFESLSIESVEVKRGFRRVTK
jgi:hypothetical protein